MELLLTTMKHYIWGEKSLSKKEKSLLKFHGVISPEKQRAVIIEDGEVFIDGELVKLDSGENSTKGSKARLETNESALSKKSLRPGSAKSDKSKKQGDKKEYRSLESLTGVKKKELRFQMDEALNAANASNSQLNSLD